MTSESVSPPPAHGRGIGSEGEPKGRRQVVKFSFFRVDPAWRALPAAEREAHKAALAPTVESFADRLQAAGYLRTVGDIVGSSRLPEQPSCAAQSLFDGGFAGKESTCDL